MYFGIDPSLNSSGWNVIDDDGNELASGLIKPDKKLHHSDKFVFISESLALALLDNATHPLECVTIEKPFFGPNKLTAQFCMGVWGAMTVVIKRFCPKRFVEVHPNYLKKFVMNKYTGTKEAVRFGVYKAWAYENDSSDIIDAYACAQFGMCATHPERFDSRRQAVVQDYMRLHNAGFVSGDE